MTNAEEKTLPGIIGDAYGDDIVLYLGHEEPDPDGGQHAVPARRRLTLTANVRPNGVMLRVGDAVAMTVAQDAPRTATSVARLSLGQLAPAAGQATGFGEAVRQALLINTAAVKSALAVQPRVVTGRGTPDDVVYLLALCGHQTAALQRISDEDWSSEPGGLGREGQFNWGLRPCALRRLAADPHAQAVLGTVPAGFYRAGRIRRV